MSPCKLLAMAALALGLCAPPTNAAETPQTWELVVPTGIVQKASIKPAPRISALDHKTVVLRWNDKHNGNVVLDRIAELIAKKFPATKVIKAYEVDPSLNGISGNAAESAHVADAVAAMKPDLVIASQCD